MELSCPDWLDNELAEFSEPSDLQLSTMQFRSRPNTYRIKLTRVSIARKAMMIMSDSSSGGQVLMITIATRAAKNFSCFHCRIKELHYAMAGLRAKRSTEWLMRGSVVGPSVSNCAFVPGKIARQ